MNQTHSSIQQKLMRLALITSGVVLFLTCVGFCTYEYSAFRHATKERLGTLGEILAANSTAALAFQMQKEAVETLETLKAEKHIVAAALYDINGNLFAKYPSTIANIYIPFKPEKDGYLYTNGFLEGFQPVEQENGRLGTLFLRSDLTAIFERFERYGLISLLVILLSVLVAYLLSHQLQKKISTPLLRLAETASTISNRSDYTVRAQKFEDDEIGVLTDAFNKMLVHIERQNAEILSFNHELEVNVNERTIALEQANIELKLKSEFEETIIDSSVDIIVVYDKQLNYVIANKYAQDIYKVSARDVIGKNLLEVFPQAAGTELHKKLQEVLITGKLLHSPYYKSAISHRVLDNYYIPLFDKNNQVDRVLLIGHDITEISDANEKLKTVNKELEKSNHDLEQFAFVASHDLQEPLRKIQTFSNLVAHRIDDKDAVRNYVGKIISASQRMTDLIRAVLNYSKLSNEKVEFEKVDLNVVLDGIKSDYELTIAEKEAVIKSTQLPVLRGNLLQLNQLFLNLISNSLKFSKDKPEITITSTTIETDTVKMPFLNGGAKYAELVFTDNGIGFDERYTNKIFTVFQRLHSKHEYPGTGIGLALCKKIVENHNGHIRVNSVPGQGTSFKIYLPLDQ